MPIAACWLGEMRHGLASRPLETSDPGFLDDLLRVFGYFGGSGALLLAGQLPLRYCTSLVGVCQNVAPFILYLPLFGKGLV